MGPFSPRSPTGPIGPVGPFSPLSPRSPTGPTGPFSPLSPRSPTGPAGPLGPLSPGSPAGPTGPVGPFTPRSPSSTVTSTGTATVSLRVVLFDCAMVGMASHVGGHVAGGAGVSVTRGRYSTPRPCGDRPTPTQPASAPVRPESHSSHAQRQRGQASGP